MTGPLKPSSRPGGVFDVPWFFECRPACSARRSAHVHECDFRAGGGFGRGHAGDAGDVDGADGQLGHDRDGQPVQFLDRRVRDAQLQVHRPRSRPPARARGCWATSRRSRWPTTAAATAAPTAATPASPTRRRWPTTPPIPNDPWVLRDAAGKSITAPGLPSTPIWPTSAPPPTRQQWLSNVIAVDQEVRLRRRLHRQRPRDHHRLDGRCPSRPSTRPTPPGRPR